MEPPPAAPPKPPQAVQPVQSTSLVSSGGIFNILGKLFLVLIMVGVLATVGFYFRTDLERLTGLKIIPAASPLASAEEKLTASPEVLVPPNSSMTLQVSPSPQLQSVLPNPSVAKTLQTLSYQFENATYDLQAPAGWKVSQGKENYATLITFSSGESSLVIKINNATEGAPCGFPDAPMTPSEMFPDVSEFTYKTYTEFKGSQGQTYRRVNGKNFFAVCEKKGADWIQPTGFGFISYKVPYSDNPEKTAAETLKILDTMFASLKVKS